MVGGRARLRSGTLALLLLGAGLSGCAASVGSDRQTFLATNGPVNDFALPVSSMEDRKFAGVVRQHFDFSCGSASLATLLRYEYGLAVDEPAVFRGMWQSGDHAQIQKVGFSLLDMRRYLAAHGLSSDGFKVGIDKVRQVGVPGIALIATARYRHFVVVKGVSATEVLLGDPAVGLRTMPLAEFVHDWNGVYFVLNADLATGKSHFNTGAQWAAFARAPIGGRFAEPLSLQALALTAPFYRDF